MRKLPLTMFPEPSRGLTIGSTDEVVQLIRDWIDTARLQEDDRLPTERALADHFEINRNVVRRAFMQLDRMGLISRHVGRGTFVGRRKTPPPLAAIDDGSPPLRHLDVSPAAILQMRVLIEPQIVALAVSNARQVDIEAIERLIDEAAGVATLERLMQLDIEIHLALARATHNDLIIEVAKIVAAARTGTILRRVNRLSLSVPERAGQILELRGVLDALRARDPASAVHSVEASLLRTARMFSLMAQMELLPDLE